MTKYIIDSEVLTYYIISEIVGNGLVCYRIDKLFYNCHDSHNPSSRKLIPEHILNTILRQLKKLKIHILQTKDGSKIEIRIPSHIKEKLKKLRQEIELACKNECYVTPDVGVSARRQLVNPVAFTFRGAPIDVNKDIWNDTLKEVLQRLDARILLDKDFEKLIGKEAYERLKSFWKNFLQDTHVTIYTDPYNEITPIFKVRFIKDIDGKKIEGEITAIYDRELEIHTKTKVLRIAKEDIEKHQALQKVMEVVQRAEQYVTELAEAEKRVSLSELEKGKVRTYHGIEGVVDFYLRAVSRNPDVKILTTDKDLYETITIISKPNKKNIKVIEIYGL